MESGSTFFAQPSAIDVESDSAQMDFDLTLSENVVESIGPAVFYDESAPIPTSPQSYNPSIVSSQHQYPTIPSELGISRAHIPLPPAPTGKFPSASNAGSLLSHEPSAMGVMPLYYPGPMPNRRDAPSSGISEEKLVRERSRGRQQHERCGTITICLVLILSTLIIAAMIAAVILSTNF